MYILVILKFYFSDGLLKIWNVETSESVGSFDAHDDKIWAVESWQEKIVTGGRDGQIIVWKNVTEKVWQLFSLSFIFISEGCQPRLSEQGGSCKFT